MGVFTFITNEQLAAFLADYDLGKLDRFEGIQQGVSNTNYHVWTDRGHYILTLFESATDVKDLPFFFAFTEHLFEHGIACPRALANKHGKIFGILAGKSACLINFLPGHEVKNTALTPDHCARMGTLVGRMHKAALNFPFSRSNPLNSSGWQAIAQKVLPRVDELRSGTSFLLRQELDYLSAQWPDDALPRAVVHADLFLDNILFTETGPPAVIDFYYSCTDFLSYDLALVINDWCFNDSNQFMSERFAALFDAYQTERLLTTKEKEFFNLLCRGAVMRIIMTRSRDWLFPPAGALVKAKNPLDYIARLEFHQHEQILR